MKPAIIFRNLYFFSLILLAVSLPLSIFTTSLAEILLVVSWAAEGNILEKLNRFRRQPAVWIIIGLYLLHLLGLLYTTDFHYAFHDLKIKLPILILPFVIGTSDELKTSQLRTVLLLFCLATIASSFISFFIFLHIIPVDYYDIREISLFVSHIRLALMVVLSIAILVYCRYSSEKTLRLNGTLRTLAIPAILWLVFFLFVLKSFTGIVVFILLFLTIAWKMSKKIQDPAPRFMIRVFLLFIPLLIVLWITSSVSRYYSHDRVDFSQLDSLTAGGNPYFHDTLSEATENGHYVWLNVSMRELKTCWDQRSEYKFDGRDKMGQEIKYTLIRYLTSKNLRKDCVGVNALSDRDVHAIENGVANVIFLNRYSLYPRIYQIIWGIDLYEHGGSPGGHSIAQRFAYLKAAGNIVRHNMVIGVGTGDVQRAFDHYYESHDSNLAIRYRRRAHNQYVTFFITFGIVGGIMALFSIFAPVFIMKKQTDFLFLAFFLIGLLSMLNEDTLETQTGVSFFMFFYCLLIFRENKND